MLTFGLAVREDDRIVVVFAYVVLAYQVQNPGAKKAR
jgi:hypothetical protein